MTGKSFPSVAPDRVTRALVLLSYLLQSPDQARFPLALLEQDLGLTRKEILEDARLLNLVNFGGGTSLLFIEQEGEDLVVDREALADNMQYPARLSPTLAQALLLALDLVGTAVAGDASVARALRDKLISALTIGKERGGTITTGSLFEPPEALIATLSRAIRESRLVTIEYYTQTRAALTARTVEPYFLRREGDGWYLDAFCLASGEPRTFRVDLIREAEATSDFFEPRPEFSCPAGAAHSLQRWATLSFAVASQPDPAAPSRAPSAGTLAEGYARLPYFSTPWLVDYVLSGLGKVELKEDEDTRAAIAKEARELLDYYLSSRRCGPAG